MVIILDQVEEVFTQVNHLRLPELEELAAELARGFGPTSRIQGRLILSFRKEWLPEIQKILESANIETRKVFLEAIGSNAIIETVRGLTTTPRLREKYELRIDELLPMRIAGDLLADRDSPLAPTLQILLTRMWQKARERDPDRPEFTLGLFNELKKQGIVMTDFLNQQLDLVYEQQPDAARTGLAVDLLTFHTTAAGTSRQRTREEIIKAYGQPESELWGILEACSATALLTEVDGGFRLSHDTLGPVVRQKFVESQLPGQRAKRLLDAAEQDWDESETPWFEKWELAIIEQGLAGMHRIPPRQQKLLDRAREAMMIRDRRDAHHARLIRIAQGVVLLLLIGTGIAWWNAFRDKRLAELHHQFVMIDRYAWADPFAALAVAVQSAARSLKQEKLVLTELQKGLSQTYDDSREVDRIGLDSPLRALAVGAQSVLAGDNLGRVHVHRAGGVGRRSFQAHEQPITAIAASPDGTWFATADRGGSAKLWHSDADVEPSEIGAPRTGLHVTSMAAAPNGALLFSGWTDGAVDVYSVYGRRIEQKIKAACGRSSGSPPTAVSKIAATRSRQGETLLAIGCDDGRTGVWNASTRRWRRPLVTAFEDDSVSALDIVTPGQGPDFMLAAGSSTGAVRVWRDGSLERGTEQQYHSSVLALRFNSRADLIAVGTQDGVLHVMYTDGTPFRSPFPGFAAAITAVAFDSESHHILASSKDGTLRSIDLEGVGAGIAVSTDDNRVTSLAFAAGDTMLVGITSENLWLWSIHRESNVHLSFARKIPRAGSEQYDTTLAISPVRPWIAYGGDHCVRLLDSTTFQELQPIQVGLPRVKSLAWSPNGDYLAIGGEGADVYLWDAKGKRLLNKANADHISTTRSLIFSPNGQYLFTTGDNGRVRRFSVVPGSGLQPSPMRCAGKQRISEGGCLETTDFHGGVYVLAYPSTGTSLLVGDAAGVVRIFYDDGEREGSRFRAHNGPVQNIRVHPDGEAIYTSSDEGVVQAHSHTTHEQLCVRLNGQAGGTFGLALTSNGSLLASGNDDGTVELWRPHWKTLAEAACQRLQQHPRFTNPDATTEGPHVFQAIQEAAAACAVKFWQNP
jgi:WD40 repeat protein